MEALAAELRPERRRVVTVLVRFRWPGPLLLAEAAGFFSSAAELSELRGVEVGDSTALVSVGSLLALMWSFFLWPGGHFSVVVFFVLLLFTMSRSTLGTFSSEGVMGEGVAEARRATSGCWRFGRKM